MPKTWLPDPSHYPEQMSPLSATVWFEAVGVGLHEAMRELCGPFGGFEARTELGWAYEGNREVDWQPADGSLLAAALGLRERWTNELAPRSHDITAELRTLRPEVPHPDGAVALMDRFWSLVLEQWTIHFLAVIPAQVGIEMLQRAYGPKQNEFGEEATLLKQKQKADKRVEEIRKQYAELHDEAVKRLGHEPGWWLPIE